MKSLPHPTVEYFLVFNNNYPRCFFWYSPFDVIAYIAFTPAVTGYFLKTSDWHLCVGVKALDIIEQSWFLFSLVLFPTLLFFFLFLTHWQKKYWCYWHNGSNPNRTCCTDHKARSTSKINLSLLRFKFMTQALVQRLSLDSCLLVRR